MPRKLKQKLVVPFGLDAKLVRSRYAAMLPVRKKAFGAEFERFSELQHLRAETAAQSAREAGIKPSPLSKQSLALARRTVATLKRLRPDIPRHFPPDVPSPVLAGPPYNASVPVDFSSSGEVDFRAWDAGPKAATGQVGGALNTWSGGVGISTQSLLFSANLSGQYGRRTGSCANQRRCHAERVGVPGCHRRNRH